MTFSMEYPRAVRPAVKCPAQRSIPATLALLAMFLLPLLLVSSSPAQNNSASVASSSSGHSSGGSASSVSSVGHTGYVGTTSGVTSSAPHSTHGWSGAGTESHSHGHPHHPASTGTADYPYVYYVVPYPYAADASPTDTNNADADDDDEYQGGPTIFDRRGSGTASYVPPTYEGPAHARAAGSASAEPDSKSDLPEPPQPPTTLVFKDGHQLELENYAIVSQTLYDLTPGHPRKIALADLDLPATEKQNDDHGVTFQLPPAPQAN